jgi:antitoxin component of MazEF toxin-antitoxin module
VYFALDTHTWGEHAVAINALAHDLGLDEQATIELALSSLGKVGVPVERLQTFSRKELVAKVQEMYPNDEEGSVGDLQAFIVDTLTKQQKMKKFYEE